MAKTPPARVTGEKIWLDGRLVPWAEANVHVLTHTLHYGLGVFEGIRCYRTADGRSAVFRLSEHVKRLFDSAHINLMPMPYTPAEIENACLETLRANGLAEGYLRPLAFIGEGVMGLNPADNPIRVAVIAWAWGFQGSGVVHRTAVAVRWRSNRHSIPAPPARSPSVRCRGRGGAIRAWLRSRRGRPPVSRSRAEWESR